ncbi:MAG: VanZ family protein [Helicobacteraceae bacterium]|jgi:VanZ family protein|nr:VanZ family protein [Helicobacteraceae bacterium]
MLFYFTFIAITVIAFLPNYNALPSIASCNDLYNHAIAFTVLYMLLAGAYSALAFKQRILFFFALAFSIEGIQYFLPTRDAALSDIAADIVGLLFGYFIVLFVKKARLKKVVVI